MKNQMQIQEGKLTESEIKALTDEIEKTQHIVYVRPDYWHKIKVYIARIGDEFAGVCGVVYIQNDWIKIGPMVVLSAFQRKGYGKKLFQNVISTHENKKIFVESSNPAVIHTAQNFGFKRTSPFSLPFDVIFLLFRYIFNNFDVLLVKQHYKKRVLKSHQYQYFMKLPV